MDRCHHDKSVPPRRAQSERGQAGGSFSASLLDAICRSLDGGGGDDGNGADITSAKSEALAPPQFWWASEAARQRVAVARPRHSGYASSTASDSSSSYGFSCSSSSASDAEPSHRRHLPPPLAPAPAPAETATAATTAHCKAKKKKRRPCLLGARLRELTNLKGRGSPSPPSPPSGASLLKALFTLQPLQRKAKSPTAAPPPSSPAPPASCLKEPSSMSTSRGKAPDAAAEDAGRRSVTFCTDVEAAVVRRRVEELVRSLGEVAEENSEEGSDASSDLFELETLRGVDGDELPVYGTTSLAANHAASQGPVC